MSGRYQNIVSSAMAAAAAEARVVPSQESLLGDAVNSVRRRLESKSPDSESRTSKNLASRFGWPKIHEELKKTYLNPKWVSLSKQVTGEVSGEGISRWLALGDDIPEDLTAAVKQHIGAVDRNVRQILQLNNDYARRVNSIGLEMARRLKSDDAADEVLAWADAELKKIPTPDERYRLDAKNILGNPALREEGDNHRILFSQARHRTPVTPVDKNQVVSTAGLIVELVQSYFKLNDISIEDVLDVGTSDALEPVAGKLDGSLAGKIFRQNFSFDKWLDMRHDLEYSLLEVAVAIERLVSRSIK